MATPATTTTRPQRSRPDCARTATLPRRGQARARPATAALPGAALFGLAGQDVGGRLVERGARLHQVDRVLDHRHAAGVDRLGLGIVGARAIVVLEVAAGARLLAL